MKKLIVAALFSIASLAQAGPLVAATAVEDPGGGQSLIQRLSAQAQGLSDRASDVVFSAMAKIDVPYRLGGNSRDSGFDCSGLVHAVYQQTLGLALPRRAAEQASSTQKIAKEELRPGDLVFFNTMRRSYSHVGIYIGDNKFIHAPRTGARVRVENMDIKYWQSRFDGARRVSLSAGGSDEAAPRLTSAFAPSAEGINESSYQLAQSRLSARDAALSAFSAKETASDTPSAEAAATKPAAQKETRTAVAGKQETKQAKAHAKSSKSPAKAVKQAKGDKSKPNATAKAKAESGKTKLTQAKKVDKVKSASTKASARRA